MHRLLSPLLCQFSATPPHTRHILWRKIRKPAAVPVFAAVHFGDKVAKIENDENYSQSVISVFERHFIGLSTTV
jgi:hypothetical protein